MSSRKNRRIELDSSEAKNIILQVFEKYNLPLQKVKEHSEILGEICKKLQMNKKAKFKRNNCKIINYHIHRMLDGRSSTTEYQESFEEEVQGNHQNAFEHGNESGFVINSDSNGNVEEVNNKNKSDVVDKEDTNQKAESLIGNYTQDIETLQYSDNSEKVEEVNKKWQSDQYDLSINISEQPQQLAITDVETDINNENKQVDKSVHEEITNKCEYSNGNETKMNNTCVSQDGNKVILENISNSNNKYQEYNIQTAVQNKINDKDNTSLAQTDADQIRVMQVSKGNNPEDSNNSLTYDISSPSSEAHADLERNFEKENETETSIKNYESCKQPVHRNDAKSNQVRKSVNIKQCNDELNHDHLSEINSPSSEAHGMVDMDFETEIDTERKIQMYRVRSLSAFNTVNIGSNKNSSTEKIKNNESKKFYQADIINTQVRQEFDNHSESHILYSHSKNDTDGQNKQLEKNTHDEITNKQTKHDSCKTINTKRNNRDPSLSWKFANFRPTGLCFYWTRKQLDEVTSLLGQSKNLTTYNEADRQRKNVGLDNARNLTSYHDLVRVAHPDHVMYIRRTRYKGTINNNKMKTMTIETYCKHEQCKRFICKAKFRNNSSEDVKFDIFEDSQTTNHPYKKSTQVRGKDKINYLLSTFEGAPVDTQRKGVIEFSKNPRKIALNDMGTKVTTKENARKLHSEAKMRTREDPNEFNSLKKMSDKPDTLILRLWYKPFLLILLTAEMIDTVLQAVKLYGPLIWYFDATGKYWRDPRENPINRILYMYSLLTRFASNPTNTELMTFPLAIVFTTAHNTTNIAAFTQEILNVISKKTSKPFYEIFRIITTDFSMANLNALPEVFNRLTIVEYLKKCNDIIEKLRNDNNYVIDIVVIKLCSSHLSKLYENIIGEYFKEDQHAGIICSQNLKALYNIRNIDEAYKLLKKLWQYLLSESDEERNLAYNNLDSYKCSITGKGIFLGRSNDHDNNADTDKADISSDTEETSLRAEEEFDSETIYGSSPFYRKAYHDFQKVLKKKSANFELLNEPKCDFILKIIRRYITYLPLITTTLTYKHHEGLSKYKNDEANRANNGVIEAHHKNTKKDIRSKERFVGAPPIRIDDYINHIFREDLEYRIALFKLQIPNSRVTRNCRSTEKKKITTPSKKRKSRSLETTPHAKVRKIDTPSISNSMMMSRMRISDIKYTRETFEKRIQPLSQTNLSGAAKKKTNRMLFSPNRHSSKDVISCITDVTKTPVAASTPLHEQIIKQSNLLIHKTKVPFISNVTQVESTISALEVIPEEQSEQINSNDEPKFPAAESTPLHEQKQKTNKLIQITSVTATSKSESIENTVSALQDGSAQLTELSKKVVKSLESDLCYLTNSSSALYGFSYQVQENHLISNIEYYTKPRNTDCDILNVAVKCGKLLNFEEIFCLTKNNYKERLINFLVDFCMVLFSSMYFKSVSITELSDSDILLGLLKPATELDVIDHRKNQMIKVIMDKFNTDQVILPILRNGHYTCVIIDQVANTLCYLDSLLCFNEKRNEIATNSIKEKFIKNICQNLTDCQGAFDVFIEKMKSLKLIYKQINYQIDSHNCGVHLLNNVEKILQGKETLHDISFNPMQYRKHLIATIIINSDSVLNICPGCSQIEKSFWEINPLATKSLSIDTSITDWIECIHCKRYWHTSCAIRKHGSNNLSSFTCLMCQALHT